MHTLIENLGPHVFENIVDGVLLLTSNGTIAYMNPSAQDILSIDSQYLKESFPGRWLQHSDTRNDEFCQVILDALYNKQKLISKKVKFYNEQGKQLVFHIKSSYWSSPNDATQNGVLLIIQDVTTEEHLKEERDDAIHVFSVMLVGIGFWILFSAALDLFQINMPTYVMTYLVILFGSIASWIIQHQTSFKFSDIGLSFKNTRKPLIFNLVLSVTICVLMILLKAFLIKSGSDYFPPGTPFWDFTFDLGMMLYPISVVMQEFLSQGIIHECLIRILNGKHTYMLSIFLSSTLFTILHIHRGFLFMIASLFLVCIIGIIYRKQRTIWGICITHYTIAMASFFLGYV